MNLLHVTRSNLSRNNETDGVFQSKDPIMPSTNKDIEAFAEDADGPLPTTNHQTS